MEQKQEIIFGLEEINKELCKKYQLGKYIKYKTIETGMEDLNYCLITKENKYLIKILNQNRNKVEFKDYIEKH